MGILRKLREWRENEDGTLEGPSLKTDEASIKNLAASATLSSDQAVGSGITTKLNLGTVLFEDEEVADINLSDNKITLQKDGKYALVAVASWAGDGNWSTGDAAKVRPAVDGATEHFGNQIKVGTGVQGVSTPPLIVEVTNPPTDIEIEVRQSSGDEQTINSGKRETRLMVWRVG